MNKKLKILALSKKETKIAEETTTPAWNFTNKSPKLFKMLKTQFDWYISRPKLKTNTDRKNFLISKLGKPTYYANYEFRNAVWGLSIHDASVVVYYSIKGFSFQIDKTIDVSKATLVAKDLLTYLKK